MYVYTEMKDLALPQNRSRDLSTDKHNIVKDEQQLVLSRRVPSMLQPTTFHIVFPSNWT